MIYERHTALDCLLRARYFLVFADPEAPPYEDGFRMRRAWPELIALWWGQRARQTEHAGCTD